MTFIGTLLAVFVVILFAAGMVEESFRDERIAKRKRDERIAKMFRDERIAKMKCDERIAKMKLDERIAKMKCRRSESQMTGLQAHRLKLDMMRHNASAPDGEKQSCPAWLDSFPDSNSPVVGCDCFVCKTINDKMLDSASPRDFARLGLSLLILARTERMARDGVDQKKKLTDKAQTLLAQSRSLGGR